MEDHTMHDPIEMLVGIYKNKLEGQDIYDKLRAMHLKGEVHIIDLAVMEKAKDGTARFEERDDLEGREGRRIGAVIGGLIGLAMGPGGGIAGAALGTAIGVAAGSVAGGAAAGAIDSGIKDSHFKSNIASIEPTSSAVLVIAEAEYLKPVKAAMDAFNAQIKRYRMQMSVSEVVDG